ncbi:hypothetical protein [Brevibacterium gallinarum]|uniref:Tail assembly chaperone n=1 Tax=Brevibacterium gallinarum TaxID=2762220 RepID=A0ABR8WR75_9MICO|nr:hypothetical protein [Brevibacterium gallinarum]MBD8019392.1 hypothetical protein [Brevibacterium gallinarum]
MAAKKTDKPKTHAVLETLANEVAGDDLEQYSFSFGGKRFVCRNPFDADFDEMMSISEEDLEGQVKQLLGDEQYEAFMEKKPKLRHVAALATAAQQFYQDSFGNPGESGGSQTS